MKLKLVFFFLIDSVYALISVQPFAFQANLTIPNTTVVNYAVIRNTQTEQYVSTVENGVIKIIKFNTSSANVYRLGEYLLPAGVTHPNAYAYVYFFRGYIMACNFNYPCRLFNESSFGYIGSFNSSLVPLRGFFMQSRSLFVFTTKTNTTNVTGYWGYFTIDQFPNINPITIKSATGVSYIYADQSKNETYFAVTYQTISGVEIYNCSNFQLLKTVTGQATTDIKQVWSGDERYLMVLYGRLGRFIVFDRNSNWTIVKNFTTNYTILKYGFYYPETNVAVTFASNNATVIAISFDTYAINQFLNVTGTAMIGSNTEDGFAIMNGLQTYFYTILSYCSGNKIFNKTSGLCVVCGTNCTACLTLTTCKSCMTQYYLSNGTCQFCPTNCTSCTSAAVCLGCISGTYFIGTLCAVCSSGTWYDSSALVCRTCPSLCTLCTSSSVCSSCSLGNYLIGTLCGKCSNGTVYNSSTRLCDQCGANCSICSSPTICTTCLVSPGTYLIGNSCGICGSGFFYNSSTFSCSSCGANCDVCLSAVICTKCHSTSGTNLIGTSCGNCPAATFYNASTFSCNSCGLNCSVCLQSSNCTECVEGTFLVSGFCLNTLPCPKNCIKCSSKIGKCMQCQAHYELTLNLTCQSCLAFTFYDSYRKTCQSCSRDCVQCANRLNCVTCANGKILIDGFCLTEGSFFDATSRFALIKEIMVIANKIPGGRTIFRQVFYFFATIDQLWLYIYHKRYYGFYVSFILRSAQQFEDKKWKLISNDFFQKFFGFDPEYLSGMLNHKFTRTSYKFIEIQSKSSSFLQNSIHYFFLNVPLVFVNYLILKMLYTLVKKFQIGSFLKEIPLNALFIFMLFEGNIQLFSYDFMFDTLNNICFKFEHKMLNFLTSFLFWITIMYVFTGIFTVKYLYSKHTEHFLENCQNNLKGVFTYCFQTGFVNFLFASAHFLLDNHYNTQLLVLCIMEVFYISLMVILIGKSIVILSKITEWLNVFTAFLRINLIVSYFIDQNNPGQIDPIENVQMIILAIYFLAFFLSTFAQILLSIKHLIKTIIHIVVSKTGNLPIKEAEKTGKKLEQLQINVSRPVKQKNLKTLLRVSSSQIKNQLDKMKTKNQLNPNEETLQVLNEQKSGRLSQVNSNNQAQMKRKKFNFKKMCLKNVSNQGPQKNEPKSVGRDLLRPQIVEKQKVRISNISQTMQCFDEQKTSKSDKKSMNNELIMKAVKNYKPSSKRMDDPRKRGLLNFKIQIQDYTYCLDSD